MARSADTCRNEYKILKTIKICDDYTLSQQGVWCRGYPKRDSINSTEIVSKQRRYNSNNTKNTTIKLQQRRQPKIIKNVRARIQQ
jgi:hypothetical protein